MQTNEQHVQYGGELCPNCGSKDIEAKAPEADCDAAWAEVVCASCGLEYIEEYVLTGYRVTKSASQPVAANLQE